MADLNIVVGKLHEFETADDLAEYFREYGIKAKPQMADSCAISMFVGMETGELGNIMTTTREISLQEYRTDYGGFEYKVETVSYQHTHAMAQFVRKFDNGEYSFLVSEGAEYDPEALADLEPYCYCKECRP